MNRLMVGTSLTIIGSYICYNYLAEKVKRLVTTFKMINGASNSLAGVNQAVKINNSLVIEYNYVGKKYKVYLPYDDSLEVDMTQLEVYLIKADGVECITQQPGIPYMITPDNLGGSSIRVVNQDSELIKDFGGVPGYCNEMF